MDLDNEPTMRSQKSAAHTRQPLGSIDQYRLERELGGGGFGTVYLAEDAVSGVKVAVKGLPPLVKNNKEELENIRRNFALVSRLTHENIAKALVLHPARQVAYSDRKTAQNLRVQDGDTLMVMDYAPGVTLSSWRKQFPDGKVPEVKTVKIVRQIASALDYAHSQRIVHRDIKPSNIMIDEREDGSLGVSVLDFGLAAEIRSSMSRVSMTVTDMSGTRPYMAPEQWQGRRQGEATDQYALAALTYELLTGDVPFASAFATGDPMVMMNVVVNEPPEIPRELPKPVRNALAKALAKKMEERFATCGDFVKALEGGQKFLNMGGRASSRAVILALLALAAAGGGGWWYWQDMKVKEQKRIEEERKAFQLLRESAVNLKARVELAYGDAKKRGFENYPELAGLLREFNRNYLSGMEFFTSTNYVAATNAFVKLGDGMKSLVDGKKRLDDEAARIAEEERRRREREAKLAELRRLEGLGYVIRNEEAVWEAGRPHKTSAMLETDENPETWRSVKAGYKWDGKDGVEWCSGVEHPKYSHWIASDDPGKWRAKIGYKPVCDTDQGLPVLAWTQGLRYGNYRTLLYQGSWEELVQCEGCSGRGRVNSRSSCSVCNGNGNVQARIMCAECSGSGRRRIHEDCSSCTGGMVYQDCQQGCSQITRNGSVLFNRGFVCSECDGRGQKVNTSGIVGGIVAAGIAGALGGRHYRPSAPQMPTYVLCQRCSGLGGYMCSSCSGTGQIRSTCSRCSGSGKVLCSRRCGICNGDGKVARMQVCSRCSNGSIFSDTQCGKCNGAGRVWRMYNGGTPHFSTPPDSMVETEK